MGGWGRSDARAVGVLLAWCVQWSCEPRTARWGSGVRNHTAHCVSVYYALLTLTLRILSARCEMGFVHDAKVILSTVHTPSVEPHHALIRWTSSSSTPSARARARRAPSTSSATTSRLSSTAWAATRPSTTSQRARRPSSQSPPRTPLCPPPPPPLPSPPSPPAPTVGTWPSASGGVFRPATISPASGGARPAVAEVADQVVAAAAAAARPPRLTAGEARARVRARAQARGWWPLWSCTTPRG